MYAAAKTNADGRALPIPQPPAPEHTDARTNVDTSRWSRCHLDRDARSRPNAERDLEGPPRRRCGATMIGTVSPGRRASTALCSAVGDVTAWPSNSTMTSPPVGCSWPSTSSVPVAARSPASSAGVSGDDLGDGDAVRHGRHADAEIRVLHLAGRDELADDRADGVGRDREADAVRAARLALDLGVDADARGPVRRSSGPPELPWLIAASVWIVSVIV